MNWWVGMDSGGRGFLSGADLSDFGVGELVGPDVFLRAE